MIQQDHQFPPVKLIMEIFNLKIEIRGWTFDRSKAIGLGRLLPKLRELRLVDETRLRSWMREFLVKSSVCPWVTESFLYDIGETMGCGPLIMVHNPRVRVPLSYKQELRSKFWRKQ